VTPVIHLTKGNEIMKAISTILLALSMTTVHAATPEAQAESCDQIREQIRAHTGTPAKPNTNLLGKVGANKKCRFTSAEAYRAAWGDKPLPKDDRRDRRAKGREHDDD
jgi:hypothetical protein